MTRFIGVTMAKGGVGKTTTAVNISHALARLGRRVLLLDIDTQGQTAFFLGVRPDYGLAELMLGEVDAESAIYPARDNLDLLTGGQRIGLVKREIERTQIQPQEFMRRAIMPLAADYDYVIADSYPTWDSLMINLMFLVEELICPISLESASLDGFGTLVKELQRVQVHRPEIEIRYVVPVGADNRVRQTSEIINQLERSSMIGTRLCNPIRYNVKLSEAPGNKQTIFEYSPRSKGAHDYALLVKRIIADE